jgi:hypothetical protein
MMRIELTLEQRLMIAFALNVVREQLELHFSLMSQKKIDNLIEKVLPEG